MNGRTRDEVNQMRAAIHAMEARGLTRREIAAELGYRTTAAIRYLVSSPPGKAPLSTLQAAELRRWWLQEHGGGLDVDTYLTCVRRPNTYAWARVKPLRVAMARHFREAGYSLPDVALITRVRRTAHSSVLNDLRDDAQARAELDEVRRAEDASR